jgi:hypothetical protein
MPLYRLAISFQDENIPPYTKILVECSSSKRINRYIDYTDGVGYKLSEILSVMFEDIDTIDIMEEDVHPSGEDTILRWDIVKYRS